MAEHANSSTVVGQFYMVPCIFVEHGVGAFWLPDDGWMPVIGPKHRDAEHLEFDVEHLHTDWRFIPEDAYRSVVDAQALRSGWSVPHAQVISCTHRWRSGVHGEIVLKRRKCRRLMPDFPAHPGVQSWVRRRWERLEIAQALTCNRLKPGNICPHRGIDLTPFIKPDGAVICPGHGLRWDTKTGEQLPHHHAPPPEDQHHVPVAR